MRAGEWRGPTLFQVPGYVQTNLVVLPKADAYDFLVYCQRNPRPCPLIDLTDPGDPEPRLSAPGADLAHPLYGAPVKEIPHGITPVFWACGVTPQRAALTSRPKLMITHAPGHAFITDIKADQFCIP
ncbi:MAG: DUF1445 domain-containing protein [Candidatus Latescibacteria bacterium]|nr:DUF1445 domain-containing protein [Candidatus Latescibacterota bacterium]